MIFESSGQSSQELTVNGIESIVRAVRCDEALDQGKRGHGGVTTILRVPRSKPG